MHVMKVTDIATSILVIVPLGLSYRFGEPINYYQRISEEKTQQDYGVVEDWMVKLPPNTMPLELAGDEFPETSNDAALDSCPMNGGEGGATGTQKESWFYDFYLDLTQEFMDLTLESSVALRDTMQKYFISYAKCACPASDATFEHVYRISTGIPEERRAFYERHLQSKTLNKMASSGQYNPPPKVAMDELIGDSINRGGAKHRRLQNGPISEECEYVSQSFAYRLNETIQFLGTVVGASVDEDSMNSCETDEATCCTHLAFETQCTKEHNPHSLCQLSCCCKFPNSPCCQDIFHEKRCDYNNFCFDAPRGPTPCPTWYKEEEVEFAPEKLTLMT